MGSHRLSPSADAEATCECLLPYIIVVAIGGSEVTVVNVAGGRKIRFSVTNLANFNL